MKKRNRYIIVAALLVLLVVFMGCKKDNDENDNIMPPAPSCSFSSPADSSRVQLGDNLPLSVEVSNFSNEARVRFIVDTIQIAEVLAPPYNFVVMTNGWDTGIHTIKAEAYAFGPMELALAKMTIIIIDTIAPLHPPVPVIGISPGEGTTDSIYSFDASGSYDVEDPAEALLFRWDFDGDGSWDTDFSAKQLYLHKYTHPNLYAVRLEVMDTDSMVADTVRNLLVSHSSLPDACEGYVSLPYGGQVYHTIAIGNQCWLRENMNIGVMVSNDSGQLNNGIIEKYCYNNDPVNCDKYGGLYQWMEMMKYLPVEGAQGICPNGWHIPADREWKELEAYVDTKYGPGDPEWDLSQFRGLDAGKHLKSLIGWIGNMHGDNWYDFKALPGGYWESGIDFMGETEEGHFWSSTHDVGQNAVRRMLRYDEDRISRSFRWDKAAFSLRCIRD